MLLSVLFENRGDVLHEIKEGWMPLCRTIFGYQPRRVSIQGTTIQGSKDSVYGAPRHLTASCPESIIGMIQASAI